MNSRYLVGFLRVCTLLLFCIFCTMSADGQVQEERDASMLSRISAGMWCPIVTEDDEDSRIDNVGVEDSEVEGNEVNDIDNSSDSEPTLKCDIGIGIYLAGKRFQQGTLGLVGGLGSESAVLGLGWIFGGQEDNTVSIAVAIGVGAPYDSRGIHVDSSELVIGTNLSLSGSQINNIVNNIIGGDLQ